MLSFMSQTIGLVSEADLGTEHLRFIGDMCVIRSDPPSDSAAEYHPRTAVVIVDTAASSTGICAVSSSGAAAR